jgi:S1-C subfamily serine protease
MFINLLVAVGAFYFYSQRRVTLEENGREFAPVARVEERGFSPRQMPIDGSNPARAFGTAIADAVEKVMPSVVVIRTEAMQYKIQRDWFGFAYRVPQKLAGQGSGVIIDAKGHVLTSHHVVKGAQSIEVVMNDGTKLDAKVVGCDSVTDVAVLAICPDAHCDSFPAVEFGDSDAVRVGEVAIAIGSPYSLDSSVTVGHISQKGRRVHILPYEDFIQTDAAINPGNSGGPLVDVDGRLIGLNAAIHTTQEGQGVGIAFAIPSNLAMVLAKSLIEKGRHDWPWVGASFGEFDPQLRNQYFGGAGVPVEQVWRDTPAARVGLLPGDIILEVDGKAVRTEYDIYRIIFGHEVGEKLPFKLLRSQGEEVMITIQLQALPDRLLK